MASEAEGMTQLFLVPDAPDVDNLKVLLADAKAERKRLRQAYQRSQWKVQKLQTQLKRITADKKRKVRKGVAKKADVC